MSNEFSEWVGVGVDAYLIDYKKEYLKQKEEIEKLTAESTEWESKFYNEAKKVDKATRHIEILLELALEQDSENVNLIDRLKGILAILKDVNKPRKGEVVSLEELESYEPKNIIEEEYYDEMWS